MGLDQRELVAACKALVGLVENPKPGAHVWHLMCIETVEKIRSMVKPETAPIVSVCALLNNQGLIVSLFADRVDAEKKRDAFNYDPWLEPGLRDTAAPYSVQDWTVRGSVTT
jgi:hypothetical protein